MQSGIRLPPSTLPPLVCTHISFCHRKKPHPHVHLCILSYITPGISRSQDSQSNAQIIDPTSILTRTSPQTFPCHLTRTFLHTFPRHLSPPIRRLIASNLNGIPLIVSSLHSSLQFEILSISRFSFGSSWNFPWKLISDPP